MRRHAIGTGTLPRHVTSVVIAISCFSLPAAAAEPPGDARASGQAGASGAPQGNREEAADDAAGSDGPAAEDSAESDQPAGDDADESDQPGDAAEPDAAERDDVERAEAPGGSQPAQPAVGPGSASGPPAGAAWQAAPPAYPYPPGWGWQAPPPRSDPESEQPPRRNWYGEQTLIVDGAAIGLVAFAIAEDHSSLAPAAGFLGGWGYVLGAPIVHWSHGHVGKGFASLGMRAGSIALMIVGAVSCWGSQGSSCGLALLGLMGVPAAITIDAAVIAREDVPPEQARVTMPGRSAGGVPVVGVQAIDARGLGGREFGARGLGARELVAPRSGVHGFGVRGIAFSGRF